MNNNYTFETHENMVGVRLDVFLANEMESQSRSSIQKLIEDGNILVNNKVIAKNYKLRKNDSISVNIPELSELEVTAEDIPLDIVYEDNDLLVVNKPKGMVVHPAAGNYNGTMVNALMHHCKDSLSGINGVIRPGIVHRIDKNTSGLLIVAKNDKAHIGLSEQIKEHSFLREYEAVVYGNVKNDSGTIDLPIGRHKLERKKMCVTQENSRNAITHYEVIARYQDFTHIRLRLETGRTHQIRVHMAYIGYPIAGDDVYGPKKVIKALNGQCLHAKTIGFIHPITKEQLYFSSELPNYFKSFIDKIKKGNNNEG
ncbi:RluA family pseudouridine synthase [Paludicola sp. MB14-C6]|uniref:RluA family pseudouridine synthase n=1 Tax=Paludihabitans sp. MB14-C6 TaxID=3070656 RepID=UPI0027DE4379|nr:RluA family pseudouridine synthase [Paludicola sp. MB14-C6]WMJ23116.1 RluA family pseudouridine synthase [Paludicola sp. MB14-C6]